MMRVLKRVLFGLYLSLTPLLAEATLPEADEPVGEWDRRGLVVDVTLARSVKRIATIEAHQRAVGVIVLALKPHRNWYLDLANERDERDARYVSAADFLIDLRGAVAGGAAGWCFHNGAQRTAKDGKPRRSFDMREQRLFEQLDAQERQAVQDMAAEIRSR